MTRQSGFIGSKSIIRSVVSLLFLCISLSGFAQTTTKQDTSIQKNILVKFLGIQDDMMLVSVVYSNPEATRFNMSIYNAQGEILFRDIYQGKKFDRKFKVPSEQGKLNFVFAGMDDKLTRSFEVFSTLPGVDSRAVTSLNE